MRRRTYRLGCCAFSLVKRRRVPDVYQHRIRCATHRDAYITSETRAFATAELLILEWHRISRRTAVWDQIQTHSPRSLVLRCPDSCCPPPAGRQQSGKSLKPRQHLPACNRGFRAARAAHATCSTPVCKMASSEPSALRISGYAFAKRVGCRRLVSLVAPSEQELQS